MLFQNVLFVSIVLIVIWTISLYYFMFSLQQSSNENRIPTVDVVKRTASATTSSPASPQILLNRDCLLILSAEDSGGSMLVDSLVKSNLAFLSDTLSEPNVLFQRGNNQTDGSRLERSDIARVEKALLTSFHNV